MKKHFCPSFHCTTISLHISIRQLLSFFQRPLPPIIKLFFAPTNNCNYTLSLWKCDKPDSIFFLLNSLRWQPLPSFHSAISSSYGPRANTRIPTTILTASLALLGMSCCVFTSARPWPRREVRIFVWAFVKVASPRRDQKPHPSLSPPPPVTSCGICSQDVLISFGAPHTSYLAGRLTCKGDISPRFRQWMRHAGYHLAHACIGEGEKSHLSFLWLSFSFVLPPIAL